MTVAARLRVRVIPRAKRNQIAGWREGALVVRLTAPPVEGAANKLLKRFLAAELGVRPSDIEIVTGGTSREKLLDLEGISESELRARLGA
jgi:uncharacterized protein